MKCKIEIEMENVSFSQLDGKETQASRGAELARILRDLANDVENTCNLGDHHNAVDYNGNRVGKLTIEP